MIPLLPVPMDSRDNADRAYSVPYRDVRRNNPSITRVGELSGVLEVDSYRYGAKGPYRLINGKKWAPARSFRRGGFVCTPLGGNDVYLVYSGGNYWIRTSEGGPGFPNKPDRFAVIHPNAGDWLTANQRNRLNTEVLIKVGKRQVNYGETLGEARTTVSMLSRSVSTAVKALLAAKRGHWSRVPKILGIKPQDIRDGSAFSKGWLAYNYGWKPLFSDIYDSWQLLQKGFALRESHIFSAVRNLTEQDSRSGASIVSFKGESKCTAKVFYRVSDSSLNTLNQLGLINPLEIAWALQPYSFVVDWFLPVGNVLEALSARMGIDFVDGYYGVRRTSSAVTKSTFEASTYKLISGGFRMKTDYFSYERRAMPSLPLPSLYLKSPFSTSHSISALALLSQLRR